MKTDESIEPTHTPLYLGRGKEADCERHGRMVRQHVPAIVVEGQFRAARDGVALYACPECCIDLFAVAGEPNTDPERAIRLLWKQYLRDDWATLEALFATPGRAEPARPKRSGTKTGSDSPT